jgi:hypothetical protein
MVGWCHARKNLKTYFCSSYVGDEHAESDSLGPVDVKIFEGPFACRASAVSRRAFMSSSSQDDFLSWPFDGVDPAKDIILPRRDPFFFDSGLVAAPSPTSSALITSRPDTLEKESKLTNRPGCG